MANSASDDEFKQQSHELTVFIAHIVRVVNEQVKTIVTKRRDEEDMKVPEFIDDVYLICKGLTKVTLKFKQLTEGILLLLPLKCFFMFILILIFFSEARKPYFLFSADLDGVFRSYLQFLSKLRTSLSEFTNSDAMQAEVKENIESSIQLIKNFSSWINCNPLAYEMSDNGPSVKKLLELEMPDSSKMVEGNIFHLSYNFIFHFYKLHTYRSLDLTCII